MIGACLGAHPNAVLLNENDGVYDWLYSLMGFDNLMGVREFSVDPDRQFTDLVARARHKYLPNKGKRFTQFGQIDDTQVTHLILQAPDMIWHWNTFRDYFADPFIVLTRRDLRAISASILKMVKRFPWYITDALRWIDETVGLGNQRSYETEILRDNQQPMLLRMACLAKIKTRLIVQWVGDGYRHKIVDYEDFVQEPMTETTQILLGAVLEWSESNLDQCVHYNASYRNHGRFNCRPIDTKSVDKWRGQISDEQARRIMQIAIG